jgi:cytochrome oxidase Cu insertion factor (SCO1/SenC/PrrC family)
LYVASAVVVVGIVVAVALSLGQGTSSPGGSSSSVATGPAGVAEIGKPAPGFSLKDAYGTSYTLNPGDGKNHLLVFYMGNF